MDGSRKVKLVAFGTVSVVHIVGYATPSWAIVQMDGDRESYEYHYGLWQHCDNSDPTLRHCSLHGIDDKAWLKCVQTLESMGLLGLVLSIVIFLVLWCEKKCLSQRSRSNRKMLMVANVAVICTTGICIITGVAVFSASKFTASFNRFAGDSSGHLGYSFYLSTSAGVFMVLVNMPIFVLDIYHLAPSDIETMSNRQCEVHTICHRHPSSGDFVDSDKKCMSEL